MCWDRRHRGRTYLHSMSRRRLVVRSWESARGITTRGLTAPHLVRGWVGMDKIVLASFRWRKVTLRLSLLHLFLGRFLRHSNHLHAWILPRARHSLLLADFDCPSQVLQRTGRARMRVEIPIIQSARLEERSLCPLSERSARLLIGEMGGSGAGSGHEARKRGRIREPR
jgi:hypothetical protein